MNRDKLILIGAGGHSRSCVDAIEQEGKYAIAGIVGLNQEVGTKLFGYEVLATDSGMGELAKQFPFALVAAGQISSPEVRIRLYIQAKDAGFKLATVIAPTAFVSIHAKVSAGTIVMQGAIINAGSIIGSNCIINSRALIEHDSLISDHCHISTGVILNGNTTIGAGSFIGSGAIIKEGVTIGSGSLVGMGLSLRHNLSENSKYLGGTLS